MRSNRSASKDISLCKQQFVAFTCSLLSQISARNFEQVQSLHINIVIIYAQREKWHTANCLKAKKKRQKPLAKISTFIVYLNIDELVIPNHRLKNKFHGHKYFANGQSANAQENAEACKICIPYLVAYDENAHLRCCKVINLDTSVLNSKIMNGGKQFKVRFILFLIIIY